MSLRKASEGVEEATTEKEKAQRNVLRLQDQVLVEREARNRFKVESNAEN
jgi:hypothetical protein